jgi:hypothetical protein
MGLAPATAAEVNPVLLALVVPRAQSADREPTTRLLAAPKTVATAATATELFPAVEASARALAGTVGLRFRAQALAAVAAVARVTEAVAAVARATHRLELAAAALVAVATTLLATRARVRPMVLPVARVQAATVLLF